jgi:hypothetical protein
LSFDEKLICKSGGENGKLVFVSSLTGLTVSGCTGPSEKETGSQIDLSKPAATSTVAGELMDSEISTIESDLSELDNLLAEIEDGQNLTFSELDGFSIQDF